MLNSTTYHHCVRVFVSVKINSLTHQANDRNSKDPNFL
uniref:Serine carboxypeptidase-like 25 n=1 Tax=Rhizophora mucronata TaxID=61149 RepID=A0A2P2LQV2_RHIMU